MPSQANKPAWRWSGCRRYRFHGSWPSTTCGLNLADDASNLSAHSERAVQFAIDVTEETHLAQRAPVTNRRAAGLPRVVPVGDARPRQQRPHRRPTCLLSHRCIRDGGSCSHRPPTWPAAPHSRTRRRQDGRRLRVPKQALQSCGCSSRPHHCSPASRRVDRVRSQPYWQRLLDSWMGEIAGGVDVE